MKKFLPIILSVVISSAATAGITYTATINSIESKEQTTAVQSTETDSGSSAGDENTLDIQGGGSYSLEGDAEVVSGTSGDNKITIKSAEIVKTKDGKDAVVVTYGYTRVSGESESFGGNYFKHEVYQNGISLEELGNSSFKEETLEKYDFYQYKDVRAGYSADIKVPYLVDDKTTDLVVEIEDRYSGQGYIVSRSFKMK